jgi:hypothetical protein
VALSGNWKRAGHKGGERFALLVISLYQEKGEECGIDELIEETGMSLRQILRIVADLKSSRAIEAEGGKGRAPYTFRIASANDDIMASQEAPSDDNKSQDIMSSEESPAPRSSDIMSSLADATTLCQDNAPRSEDILSGTPIAPLEAEEPLSTTGANAPSARARGVAAVELPDWLPPDSWREWEQHRREIKKPLTALSVKKQIKKLDTFRARGMPPEKVIEQAITEGWRNFYELKEADNGNSNGRPQTSTNGNSGNAGQGRTPYVERRANARTTAKRQYDDDSI